jgi:hypothetical protein
LPTAVIKLEMRSLKMQAHGGMNSFMFFSGKKCNNLVLHATMSE